MTLVQTKMLLLWIVGDLHREYIGNTLWAPMIKFQDWKEIIEANPHPNFNEYRLKM